MFCESTKINDLLECTGSIADDYQYNIKTMSLEKMKSWTDPLICIGTPWWLDIGAPIEKIDVNIEASYWFGFINQTIIPTQNESILTTQNRSVLD